MIIAITAPSARLRLYELPKHHEHGQTCEFFSAHNPNLQRNSLVCPTTFIFLNHWLRRWLALLSGRRVNRFLFGWSKPVPVLLRVTGSKLNEGLPLHLPSS